MALIVLIIILISYYFVPFLCSETKVEWCLNFKTLKALASVLASHSLSQPLFPYFKVLTGCGGTHHYMPALGGRDSFRTARATLKPNADLIL